MLESLAIYLNSKGFTNITKCNEGFGIDLTAEKNGKKIGFVCNTEYNPLELSSVQSANSGKDFYDCNAVVIASVYSLTESAVEFATRFKMMVWDRNYLEKVGIIAAQPEGYQDNTVNTKQKESNKGKNKKVIVSTLIVVFVVGILAGVISLFLFPNSKTVAKNVEAAMDEGDYILAIEILNKNQRISNYNELYNKIKYESIIVECGENAKAYLKNPSSIQISQVDLYDSDKGYPYVVMVLGGQNGFGGYSSSYRAFSPYNLSYLGDTDTLDKDDLTYNRDYEDFDRFIVISMIEEAMEHDKIDEKYNLNRITQILQSGNPKYDNSVFKNQ